MKMKSNGQNHYLSLYQKIICPPGQGVYTVHTGKAQKNRLNECLYGTVDEEKIHDQWLATLKELPEHQGAILLGVCSDNGGGILRGANWGPLFLREKLYSARPASARPSLLDAGDVRVIPHLLLDEYLNQKTIENCQLALYGQGESWVKNLPVSPLSLTEYFCNHLYQHLPASKKIILGLGGDHSVSYPLVKSYLQQKQKEQKKVAVIHFDAHTDLLAERLGIGVCFGSWAYHILPYLSSPANLIQLGIRSSGYPKEYWEKQLGVQQYWAQEIRDQGPEHIGHQIQQYLTAQKIEEVYISFDIDALDWAYAFATGTPEGQGIYPAEAIALMEKILSCTQLGGADLVEVAPFTQQGPPPFPTLEPETTLQSSLGIMEFFLGAIH